MHPILCSFSLPSVSLAASPLLCVRKDHAREFIVVLVCTIHRACSMLRNVVLYLPIRLHHLRAFLPSLLPSYRTVCLKRKNNPEEGVCTLALSSERHVADVVARQVAHTLRRQTRAHTLDSTFASWRQESPCRRPLFFRWPRWYLTAVQRLLYHPGLSFILRFIFAMSLDFLFSFFFSPFSGTVFSRLCACRVSSAVAVCCFMSG